MLELPPEPESPTRARRFARAQLADALPSDAVESVALLVTELVTNAVVHARTPLRVVVEPASDSVRIEVEDGSLREPVLRDRRVDEISGRGLQLVDVIADEWGVETTETGKRVWCVVSLASDEGPASSAG